MQVKASVSMADYISGVKLLLVVAALLLRLNGFVLIYMKREKIWAFPPIVLNIFSPLLCMIVLSYVTSKSWEGLGKGRTFGDTFFLMFLLLGSQVSTGMNFAALLFLGGASIPTGRAVGPGADPANFLPLYLLLVLGASVLVLFCMLRMVSPDIHPCKFFRGRRVAQTTAILYAALVPLQLMIWGYGWVLGDAGFKSPTNPFMSFEGPLEMTAIVIAVVVLAPLAEELFFRGYLFGLLEDKLGGVPAITITAVLFAAVHFDPYTFLPILVLGGVMGWARNRTGSIVPSLVLHSMNNLIALIVVSLV
ncbi:MAG: lysostaphin resistance A-like protein [Thermoplasmatota archaeon]